MKQNCKTRNENLGPFQELIAYIPWPVILVFSFLFVCLLLGIYNAIVN